MEPLFRINTTGDENPKKIRKVTLQKQPMFLEIDSHTCKFVDAVKMETPRQENAVASDTTEHLDGNIITRLMEYRDAKLRILFKGVLEEEYVDAVDNVIEEEVAYFYKFALDQSFHDSVLKALAMRMHKYIVWGALFDWYTEVGMINEASAYGQQLKDLEDELQSMVYTAGYAKRPMQPFGPAKRMIF